MKSNSFGLYCSNCKIQYCVCILQIFKLDKNFGRIPFHDKLNCFSNTFSYLGNIWYHIFDYFPIIDLKLWLNNLEFLLFQKEIEILLKFDMPSNHFRLRSKFI